MQKAKPRGLRYGARMNRAAALVVSSLALLACGGSSAAPPAAPEAPAASAAPAQASTPAPAEIDGATARKLVKDGARLVDVRTPEEYATKHIEGAVNVPVDTVEAQDMGPKDKPIVVYCGTGKRAARAAETLRKNGYTVQSLGGMSNWDK